LASIFVVMLALVIWPGLDAVYNFVAAPLGIKGAIAPDIVGPITVPLKVLALVSLMVALPYVLYQMWAFVAPGLYQHEKKLVAPVLVSSFIFLLLVILFRYFFVFPIAFGFFAHYTPAGVQMMTDIDKYLSFVLTM